MSMIEGPQPHMRERKPRQHLEVRLIPRGFSVGSRARISFTGTISSISEGEGGVVHLSVEAADVDLEPTTLDDAAKMAESQVDDRIPGYNVESDMGRHSPTGL